MSAAEPASPRTPAVNAGGVAAVIDITKRRLGGADSTAQGRWTMATPPGPAPGNLSPEEQSLQGWAESIEKSFNEIHHTLADDDTADVFRRTLDLVIRTLEGAHATGIIDRGQLDKLAATIRWMKETPQLA